MEYGINFLKKKLKSKQSRVKTRYNYYEMKNGINDFSKMIPTEMKWLIELYLTSLTMTISN